MQGARDTVLPRNDLTAGVSRSLTHGFAAGADYRFLRFGEARVNVLSPAVEYYFSRPIWLQFILNHTWTDFRNTANLNAADFSFVAQYFQEITPRARIRFGFAHGNESYAGLSVDRLGRFDAQTWISGGDLKLSPSWSVGSFYSFQQRSEGRSQQSVGIQVTLRR